MCRHSCITAADYFHLQYRVFGLRRSVRSLYQRTGFPLMECSAQVQGQAGIRALV